MIYGTKLVGMFMMNYIMAVFFDTDWKTEIFKRLDALSEKLGVAAGHLWGVLVRQSVAEGIGSLVLALLCGIALLIAAKILKWGCKQGKADDWDGPLPFFGVIGGILGALVAGIAFGVNLYQGILWAVNPEYFALQKILELFGK